MLSSILVFVSLFMYFFDPRDTLPYPNEFQAILGYTLITGLVLGSTLFVMPRLFPTFFDPETFTFGKYLLTNILTVEVIALAITPFNQLVVWPDEIYCQTCMISDHRSSYIIAFIMLLPASYMIKAWVLSQNLQLAQETNEQLLRQRRVLPLPEPRMLTIEADTSEHLTIIPKTFLYAEAQDNYVRIFWQDGDTTLDKMLRLSLSRLEEQIDHSNIVRTHRSYLVNLDKVNQVKGNSNGLQLALTNQEFEVPVSRTYAQGIRDRLTGNGNYL